MNYRMLPTNIEMYPRYDILPLPQELSHFYLEEEEWKVGEGEVEEGTEEKGNEGGRGGGGRGEVGGIGGGGIERGRIEKENYECLVTFSPLKHPHI